MPALSLRFGSLCTGLGLILSGCITQHKVSYQRDVAPIIENKCIGCHLPPNGAGYVQSGLSMETYDALMKGTIYGPVIIPGDRQHSVLNMVVEGRLNASMRAPYPLTPEEIAIFGQWVEQGAYNN